MALAAVHGSSMCFTQAKCVACGTLVRFWHTRDSKWALSKQAAEEFAILQGLPVLLVQIHPQAPTTTPAACGPAWQLDGLHFTGGICARAYDPVASENPWSHFISTPTGHDVGAGVGDGVGVGVGFGFGFGFDI